MRGVFSAARKLEFQKSYVSYSNALHRSTQAV